MSQPPEANEINQMLAQAKNSLHAICGSANGLISDHVSSMLAQLGQFMLSQKIEITRLKKEIEDLKKKIPSKKN